MDTSDVSEYLNHFTPDERRTDGSPIDWSVADLHTFLHLDDLRADTDAPVRVIRETHIHRPGAVDFISEASMQRITLNLISRPVAVGIYAGRFGPSYHIDTRTVSPYNRFPRWMAVRPEDRGFVADFTHLITRETRDWIYLRWSHRESLTALQRVIGVAVRNRAESVRKH